MAMPDVEVSIAFDSGYMTPAASRTWTDVSAYVDVDASTLSIDRGRPDQFGQVQPSRLSVTFDNKDGRFTPEYAAGAYYPNVKKGRPIRVRARWVAGSGTWYDRFVGYVDEWPVEWPGGSSGMSTVTVSATSRMARLGRTSAFKSIVEEEYLYDDPVLYFPLGEPEGATEAGNIAPGRYERMVATQLGTGGTLEFGAGTGPGTDDLTAPVFTPVDTSNGRYLTSTLTQDVTATGDHVLEVETFFVAPDAGPATTQVLVVLRPSVGAASSLGLALYVDPSTDKAGLDFSNGAGASASMSSAATVRDGLVHHLVGRIKVNNGGTVDIDQILDGVKTSTSIAWPWVSGGVAFFPSMRLLVVGGGQIGTGSPTPNSNLFYGTIAHVAVYAQAATAITDARFADHYNAGTTGFAAEASGARVARYARLAGIPTAEVDVAETGLSTSIAHIDTTGQSPAGLMQDVVTTEDGLLFDAGNGTLTFHSRSHRYGATSAFTLSCAAGEVEADLRPVLDDQGLTNDMTASRAGGATIRSVNQASIDEYGYYRESVELVTTSDNEVQSRADWQVNRFGTPRVKVTQIGVSLVASSSAQITALLAAQLGTRFTVSNLPTQAPASTMDLFIEGTTEEIGPESYTISFNTSATAYADVWILDSSVFSVLDSTTVPAF